MYRIHQTNKQFKIDMKKLTREVTISGLQVFFNNLSDSFKLNDYIYEVLKNVCREENIFFFEVPDHVINKGVKDDDRKAAGRYTYITKLTTYEMNQYTETALMINKNAKDFDKIEWSLPSIMINTSLEYFHDRTICTTLAHELGHHFIHMNKEEQSEELANRYVLDVFKRYLPECFLAIFKIRLGIYTKMEYEDILKDEDTESYYKKYLMFREEHPELELPIYQYKS
jgi:hypothetical protein